MSEADARWLCDNARIGDPFEVTGSETEGTVAVNNGLGDWNLGWDDWRARSALR
ncbi:hypothetical protein [Streptomyces carpinensis]|uniref:Uncharacterized protein n=1 Tax=Streptomyces carpinensis TaxID=66369 RepID=A0ABV1W4S3_9ACTN